MHLPTTTLLYGMLLNRNEIFELRQKLSAYLTLTQKKALYLGGGLEDQVEYDKLADQDKRLWDELDTGDPEFMVTDFGWCEISDFFEMLEGKYPALGIATYDEAVMGIFAAGSNQNVEYADTFDINALTDISDEAKSQLAQFAQDYGINRTADYLALTW